MKVLLWFRNDLRSHDHAPLHTALQAGADIMPVYCVDPRQFDKTAFGFPKTGPYRAQFLIESLQDLRQSFRSWGSDLIIRRGHPETVLPALAREMQADAVYGHQEVTAEETAVEAAVTHALAAANVTTRTFWGTTLYHPDHLPFAIADLPEIFTQFRKRVEADSAIAAELPSPQHLPPLPPGLDPGSIPSLGDLGLAPPTQDDRAVLAFQGGETAGLARLQAYIWDADCLRVYKQTRNGLLGANYSSKLSPWLALGCVSPRRVYWTIQAYEAERVRNDSTYWLVFELLWRDYFRWVCVKHGDRIFYPSGLQGLPIAWQQDWDRFHAWCEGRTGYPFVDANMRELAATGFMSNRGRQNVASFLTKNLGIDWRLGAEWFESQLIDYDVCSNWGNWNYMAGVGNDARGFRYFNILKQARDYDPQGDYVKHWLPELAALPADKVHTPWHLQSLEQQRWQVRLGVDYPHPIVDLQTSVAANERLYREAQRRQAG
jgi:deoxyribodipyrimidine photo-lyase